MDPVASMRAVEISSVVPSRLAKLLGGAEAEFSKPSFSEMLNMPASGTKGQRPTTRSDRDFAISPDCCPKVQLPVPICRTAVPGLDSPTFWIEEPQGAAAP